MPKKIPAPFVYLLFFVILASIVVVYFYYNRWRIAESNIAEYKLAISCPSRDNCREKSEAIVVESYANFTHIISLPRAGRSRPSSDAVYFFSIDSPVLGIQTVKVSANPPNIGIPFDIGNVQIPPDTGLKFIEENFYNGEKIYIETWRGQIIFLYVDAIIDFSLVSVPVIDVPESQKPQTSLSSTPPKIYEIALPTSTHPIFLHATSYRDFLSAFIVCAFITIITLMVTLRRK